MASPLKICARCLSSLRESADGQRDIAVYLMNTGAGGVEIVPEMDCQARLVGHDDIITSAVQIKRDLAEVTMEELDLAVASLLKQLHLSPEHCKDVWDLDSAIKAEWLKALEAKGRELSDDPD